MSELFDEVNEDVRREQLKKLWDKYSLLIVAVAILIVGGVGGWRGYQYLEAKKSAEASAQFDRAVELADQGKTAEAESAFARIAIEAPRGYSTLARLRQAAAAGAREADAGVKLYDAVAADRAVSGAEQDLARLRAAGLLLDTADYATIRQRLEAVARTEGVYRHSARETLALSAWRANDAAAARQWLDMIANDGATPASLRSRAEALTALLPPVAKS